MPNSIDCQNVACSARLQRLDAEEEGLKSGCDGLSEEHGLAKLAAFVRRTTQAYPETLWAKANVLKLRLKQRIGFRIPEEDLSKHEPEHL